MPSTTMTAIPKPIAASTFFDIAKKVHMPKKNIRAILSMNMERTNKLK